MNTFIKVIEIWTPDSGRNNLNLMDSYYGEYAEFNKQSLDYSFAYNEGLPGTAWSQSSPILITDLEHSCFMRKETARNAGITCAIAIPIFSGQFLLSVIVLLCGDDDELPGAIEVWGKNPERKNELHLKNGYYGTLEKFEWISRRISFQKGTGLPGSIWDYHIPQIVSDLSNSGSFLRASNAQLEGITTAFGIPFIYDSQNEYILTFLSAKGTPIARRFEIWLPDRDHKTLSLYKGHSEIPDDIFISREIEKGQGLIGQTWLTGCPTIGHNPAEDGLISNNAISTNLNATVTIPVIEEGVLQSIAAFTL
jgi:hypothetical protein